MLKGSSLFYFKDRKAPHRAAKVQGFIPLEVRCRCGAGQGAACAAAGRRGKGARRAGLETRAELRLSRAAGMALLL